MQKAFIPSKKLTIVIVNGNNRESFCTLPSLIEITRNVKECGSGREHDRMYMKESEIETEIVSERKNECTLYDGILSRN